MIYMFYALSKTNSHTSSFFVEQDNLLKNAQIYNLSSGYDKF